MEPGTYARQRLVSFVAALWGRRFSVLHSVTSPLRKTRPRQSAAPRFSKTAHPIPATLRGCSRLLRWY